MKRKGIIFIGDINDIDKKDIAIKLRNDSESFRKKSHVSREPVEHLYYSKGLFQEIAKEYNMIISFYDEDVDELNFYHSAKYRYSVVMENAQSILDYDWDYQRVRSNLSEFQARRWKWYNFEIYEDNLD